MTTIRRAWWVSRTHGDDDDSSDSDNDGYSDDDDDDNGDDNGEDEKDSQAGVIMHKKVPDKISKSKWPWRWQMSSQASVYLVPLFLFKLDQLILFQILLKLDGINQHGY